MSRARSLEIVHIVRTLPQSPKSCLDLKALYPGNRAGSIDLWSHQGSPRDEASFDEKRDATTFSALEPPTASVIQLPPYEPPSIVPLTAFDREGTAIHPAPNDIKSWSVAVKPSTKI
jgi:hypothetical protein